MPTRVYVRAAEALWEAGVDSRGLVHISGGGLLNLARLAADVCYELDTLPPPPDETLHNVLALDGTPLAWTMPHGQEIIWFG